MTCLAERLVDGELPPSLTTPTRGGRRRRALLPPVMIVEPVDNSGSSPLQAAIPTTRSGTKQKAGLHGHRNGTLMAIGSLTGQLAKPVAQDSVIAPGTHVIESTATTGCTSRSVEIAITSPASPRRPTSQAPSSIGMPIRWATSSIDRRVIESRIPSPNPGVSTTPSTTQAMENEVLEDQAVGAQQQRVVVAGVCAACEALMFGAYDVSLAPASCQSTPAACQGATTVLRRVGARSSSMCDRTRSHSTADRDREWQTHG